MSELNYTSNPEELETSFEPVPAGEYPVIIEDSDYIDNKNGTGKILKLTYNVIDGPLKGRKLFENLNLENASSTAEQIARKALNSICVAVGVAHIQDSIQLHGIPFKIDVRVKDDPTYGIQNQIRKHIALSGGAAAPSTQASAPSPSPAATKGGGKPAKKFAWEK